MKCATKSAKRTTGNSPAIHRWVPIANFQSQSAERTTEIRFGTEPLAVASGSLCLKNYFQTDKATRSLPLLVLKLLSPVSRALNSLITPNPALKCWAIFDRPLRGLDLFPSKP